MLVSLSGKVGVLLKCEDEGRQLLFRISLLPPTIVHCHLAFMPAAGKVPELRCNGFARPPWAQGIGVKPVVRREKGRMPHSDWVSHCLARAVSLDCWPRHPTLPRMGHCPQGGRAREKASGRAGFWVLVLSLAYHLFK